jgi:predicted dehydrogenase
MNVKKTGIVLVGIGGYGKLYAEELLEHLDEGAYEIKGVVDPYPENCDKYSTIVELGIPVFKRLDDFYGSTSADLAILSTPIQFHCENTCTALANGSHVLCEKPAAATIQEVIQMIRYRDQAGKLVGIGYQWSYNDAILNLKRDILSGKFGRPLRMKSIVLWPRNWDYYARGWAGKKKDTAGNWVLDSVVANATAHYLHNMLYLLGDRLDGSATVKSIIAETYRANNIENYDTAAVRAFTDKGTEILFLAAHPIEPEAQRNPEFEYVFEKAVVSYKASQNRGTATVKAVLTDGTVIDYGNQLDNHTAKFWKILQAIQNGTEIPCGLEAASAHTVCINCIQESVPDAAIFPENLVCRDEDRKITWVKGLADVLNKCYEDWKMPCETDVEWACCGRKIEIQDYTFFHG